MNGLPNCPHCGGMPQLHRKRNKFYFECDGDCWTQTHKHNDIEDAEKEWCSICKVEKKENVDPTVKSNRISVAMAAELLDASEQFVRQGILDGTLPIGFAVKMSDEYTYLITKQKFEEVTGIKVS